MSFDFSKISHEWWDPDGPMRALHDLTPTRGNFAINGPRKNIKTAIDFGCGAGILTEWLTENGIECTGIDIEQSLIDVAIRHARLSNLEIKYECSNNLDKCKKVDLITCMEVLEHCTNYPDIIAMLAGKLKKNGILVISTINNTWKSYFKVIIGAEYLLNLVPKGTHKKSDFIKPSSVIRLAQTHGLKLVTAAGIEYLPHSRTGKITDDLSCNYILMFKNN